MSFVINENYITNSGIIETNFQHVIVDAAQLVWPLASVCVSMSVGRSLVFVNFVVKFERQMTIGYN